MPIRSWQRNCGGHDIPTEVLVRIADFYQVSVDYLLNRTDKREMNR